MYSILYSVLDRRKIQIHVFHDFFRVFTLSGPTAGTCMPRRGFRTRVRWLVINPSNVGVNNADSAAIARAARAPTAPCDLPTSSTSHPAPRAMRGRAWHRNLCGYPAVLDTVSWKKVLVHKFRGYFITKKIRGQEGSDCLQFVFRATSMSSHVWE